MSEKFLTIKEVSLKNNCPECYTKKGLVLTFKQVYKRNALYQFLTQEVVHDISCSKCESNIYPVQWTDDIERGFEYQKKAFTPKKSSFKLKKLFWALVAAIILIATGVIAYLIYFEVI